MNKIEKVKARLNCWWNGHKPLVQRSMLVDNVITYSAYMSRTKFWVCPRCEKAPCICLAAFKSIQEEKEPILAFKAHVIKDIMAEIDDKTPEQDR